MPFFRLVIFDMSGTTVVDRGAVKSCFHEAASEVGVELSPERLLALRGRSKREVFQTVIREQLGADHPEVPGRVEQAYATFRHHLEQHYTTEPVEPTDGCLDCFGSLHRQGIAIGLTTGFYREVTDIILSRLGWDKGLNSEHVGSVDTLIQASVCSDDVSNGRPAPDMIHRAMALLQITDVRRTIKVGDTRADILAGKNAGCGLTLAVTNGSQSAEYLSECDNDGLLNSLGELPDHIAAVGEGR
jgi:phosphonatase-like hydrolase